MSCLAAVVLVCSAAAAPPRPALEQLARAVAEQTRRLPAEAPVAVFVDGAQPALARALATLVASELTVLRLAPVVLDATTATDAESLARQRDLRTLLTLTVSVEGENLWARGEAFSTWVNFWAGVTQSRHGPSSLIAVSALADAATRALLQAPAVAPPSVTELSLTVSVWARLPSVPLALAALDVDGDGKAEVALLTDEAVSVFAGDGRLLARAELKAVPMAVSPSREPFGAIALATAPPRVSWVSTRRAHGEQLQLVGGTLKSLGPVQELTVEGVTLRPTQGANSFASTISWGAKSLELPLPVSGCAVRGPLALLAYPDGSASLLRGAANSARFTGTGAAVALADFDGDKSPEALLSSSRFFPEGDELRVLSVAQLEGLQSRGAAVLEATPLWRGATPRGRALAAASGDLDGDGREEVLLAVWLSDGTGEIHLVSRPQ